MNLSKWLPETDVPGLAKIQMSDNLQLIVKFASNLSKLFPLHQIITVLLIILATVPNICYLFTAAKAQDHLITNSNLHTDTGNNGKTITFQPQEHMTWPAISESMEISNTTRLFHWILKNDKYLLITTIKSF